MPEESSASSGEVGDRLQKSTGAVPLGSVSEQWCGSIFFSLSDDEMLHAQTTLKSGVLVPSFVYQVLKESDMLEESSVYQDILQKGERRGVQKGKRELIRLLLEERFGKLAPQVRKQIERLPAGRLEELGKALLHFKRSGELIAWLKQQAPVR